MLVNPEIISYNVRLKSFISKNLSLFEEKRGVFNCTFKEVITSFISSSFTKVPSKVKKSFL